MNPIHSRRTLAAAVMAVAVVFPLCVPAAPPAGPAPASTVKEDDEEMIVLSSFCVTTLGATPGGAKDINFFRSGVCRGEIPHPEAITAEGLFSEHDLPLAVREPDGSLFFIQCAATPARFDALPDVRYLGQLGFSSGLDAATWRRAPLNLVAVVDKSGSMSGEPLALVRASLLGALEHLRDGDQISVILYGDSSHVHLEPTAVERSTRSTIARSIRAIESAGSTSMEAGLTLGYQVARDSARSFAGTTRVMLFTDERPNVGNTAAAGFMGMAEAASRDGIGLTTIGVGVQFGAELATKISSVRGGNLFFFEDGAAMTKTFAQEFDTMVSELAHEFSVRIAPAPGLRLAGVFGVPGEMLRWDGDALVLDVASIFLSRKNGAIFFALAPVEGGQNLPTRTYGPGTALAEVSLGYAQAVDGRQIASTDQCRLVDAGKVQVGLQRGARLVDEYLTMKKAATLHHVNNDQESAFQLMQGLVNRLAAARDPALADEVRLASELHATLAFLSGHAGEAVTGAGRDGTSPLVGVWRNTEGTEGITERSGEYFVIWPNGVIDYFRAESPTEAPVRAETFVLAGNLPRRARGAVPLNRADRERIGQMRYEMIGGALRLEISDWRDAPASFTLTRCAYAEIEGADATVETAVELDELTGLPVPVARTGGAG